MCRLAPRVAFGGRWVREGRSSTRELAAWSSTVAAGPSGYHPDLLAVGGAGRTAHARKLLCDKSVTGLACSMLAPA